MARTIRTLLVIGVLEMMLPAYKPKLEESPDG